MKSDFVTIPASFNSLDLTASEKIALSLVYGFDKNDNGVFYGSLSYIQEWLGCSKPTAIGTMKKLIERGFICKGFAIIGEQPRRVYRINWDGLKNFTPVKNIESGSKKTLPNNIEDIDINIEREYNKRATFVKPTLEELTAYCSERANGIDPEEFLAFYDSKGWMIGKSKMKDWKATIRTWEIQRRKNGTRTATASKPARKESVYEHNLRVADQLFGTNYHDQVYGKKEVADEQ